MWQEAVVSDESIYEIESCEDKIRLDKSQSGHSNSESSRESSGRKKNVRCQIKEL